MAELRENIESVAFLPENIEKVQAEIFFKKGNGDFLFFHQIFERLEVIAIHLLKKDEWFYGIYNGAKRVGFFYDGDHLTPEQQFKCFTEYLPKNSNYVNLKVDEFGSKINYHLCGNDAYNIIGEINQKKVIQSAKIKRKLTN